ncbi:hypothetical protein [Actinokineospora sp.]|uniref:hypothetical protein n=1 Tax=Actinokineospora sp. TaxID=1872133 RepID=UPI0040377C44
MTNANPGDVLFHPVPFTSPFSRKHDVDTLLAADPGSHFVIRGPSQAAHPDTVWSAVRTQEGRTALRQAHAEGPGVEQKVRIRFRPTVCRASVYPLKVMSADLQFIFTLQKFADRETGDYVAAAGGDLQLMRPFRIVSDKGSVKIQPIIEWARLDFDVFMWAFADGTSHAEVQWNLSYTIKEGFGGNGDTRLGSGQLTVSSVGVVTDQPRRPLISPFNVT